jgi:hypothetical protein
MLIGSGSGDDVIDEYTFEGWNNKPNLRSPTEKLYSYNSDKPLPVFGGVLLLCRNYK